MGGPNPVAGCGVLHSDLRAAQPSDLTLFDLNGLGKPADQPNKDVGGRGEGDRSGSGVLHSALRSNTHGSLLSDELVSQRYPD